MAIEVPKIAAQSLERDGKNLALRFVAADSHELIRITLTPAQVSMLQYELGKAVFGCYTLQSVFGTRETPNHSVGWRKELHPARAFAGAKDPAVIDYCRVCGGPATVERPDPDGHCLHYCDNSHSWYYS